MKALMAIIRKEFIQLRRDPRLLPVIFISPVLQLLLLGYAANLDVRDIPAVVCDLDRSAAGHEFLDGFLNSGYFSVASGVDRIEDIDRPLDHGDAAMAFVFPIENMPRFFQALTYAVPARYFFVIIRGIMLKGAGLRELWPQAAALLGLGTVILTLAVTRFRKKLE